MTHSISDIPLVRPGEASTRVLFVNHTSLISGGEHALLDLLARLPASVTPMVACPAGRLSSEVAALGVPVLPLKGTASSLRLHPVHTPRGLVDIARDAIALRRHTRTARPDVIHANSTRAGLMALTSGLLGGPSVVVHVRDCMPPGVITRLVRRYIVRRAAGVIAVSDHAASRFCGDMQPSRIRVVHDAVDTVRFDPSRISRDDARAGLDIPAATPVLGVVGQITPLKGQREAIFALSFLRERRPDAVMLIVGEPKFLDPATRYDNDTYHRSLHELVHKMNLGGSVRFLGERTDIPTVLRAVDVALAPSWEEGFGRAIIEAMAMEIPTITTNVGGPAEVVHDGVDGLLLPPRDPGRWAEAAIALLDDPERRRTLGRAARHHAEQYSHEQVIAGLLRMYADVRGGSAVRP